MLNGEYIENPKRLQENRLPARTLLVPAGDYGITHENCDASDRVERLDGMWKFRYLSEDTPDALWAPELTDAEWDDLPVPSMWQYHGYGSCCYPNVEYPFPYDPPRINRDNPVGIYRLHFTPKTRSERTVLRFLGVDNAFFVYMNGKYIGFSKGSRVPSEFDVTKALTEGENLLCVKVYTYSDASYLENQDMLLASGIFRSVFLIHTAKTALWDYTVLPTERGFDIETEMTPGDGAELTLDLFDEKGDKIASETHPARAKDTFFLPVETPHLWNAEDPYLYTLTLTVKGENNCLERHTKRVGIRFSEIKGNRILLNGVPITLKGVNRHDNDPHEGRAIPTARIRAELTDIKSHNLNAVRCSHYTQQPAFYEIASELGLYVMDEADCETHGTCLTGDIGDLNKRPEWFDAYFDRTERMYRLNKNETCINIWSLGNEAGNGENYNKTAGWLSEQKIKKPLSANSSQEDWMGFRITGYMTLQALDSFPTEGRPVLMLEYGHAMGNSPGGLWDIWSHVYKAPHICGGYVWEYKSHGFYKEGKDGRAAYLYGGDFNEDYHFSNFSLDGYHTSDGTPKPSWEELSEVYAPFWAERSEKGVSVRNTYDFTPLSGAKLRWQILSDGERAAGGEIPLDGLLPHEWRKIPLPLSCDGLPGFCALDVVCEENGRVLGHKSFPLRDAIPTEIPAERAKYTVTDDPKEGVILSGEGISARIFRGLLCSYRVDGEEKLFAPVKPNLWRAPTDNDGIENFDLRRAGEWKRALYHTAWFMERSTLIIKARDGVTVLCRGKLTPRVKYWGFDAELRYTFRKNGEVYIAFSGAPYGKFTSTMPRIGLVIPLAEGFDRVAWIGRGPGDSYSDRKTVAHFGKFDSDIHGLNFAYDVPQETGNHEDTTQARVYGAQSGRGITVAYDREAPKAFAFSCHDMTLTDLTAARHGDELNFTKEKYLYIDETMRGLGSLSCGPDPEEPYELHSRPFKLRIALKHD